MVTIELVCGILIVMTMLALFGWAVSLFGMQAMCIDTASDIARQTARGDSEAVQRVRDSAPEGAVINIDKSAAEVEVTVRLASKPFDFVPPVHLKAVATAVMEPGS
jgi:hypothetical protein